jgi:predicted transcriptional regulator
MMRHTKNNFGGMHENIALKITFSKKKNGIIKIRTCDMTADSEFRGRLSAADQIIFSLTKDGDADTKQLSERTVLPEKTLANRLPRMEKEGLVRVVKKSGRKQIWGIVKAKGKTS